MDAIDILSWGTVFFAVILVRYIIKRRRGGNKQNLSTEKWNAFHSILLQDNGQVSDKDKVKTGIFIQSLFVPDSIDFDRFSENLEILNGSRSRMEVGFGSNSMKKIEDFPYLPVGFDNFFVAAYPDVYQWFQQYSGSGKVSAENNFEDLDEKQLNDFLGNPVTLSKFYRMLIEQFKSEGNRLECSIS